MLKLTYLWSLWQLKCKYEWKLRDFVNNLYQNIKYFLFLFSSWYTYNNNKMEKADLFYDFVVWILLEFLPLQFSLKNLLRMNLYESEFTTDIRDIPGSIFKDRF